MRSVRDADLSGKTVFLRVDYNVPMEDGKILDANRITKSLATVKYLLEHKAKIVMATHFGKPKGKVDTATSTIPLAEELSKQLGHKVEATDYLFGDDVSQKIKAMQTGDIFMLGNLRWDSGEEANDEEFARKLAAYAELYVNDAFGASHRAHASIDAITHHLPSYTGFLLESEVTTLSLLLDKPVSPFILIMGGAKIEDKVGMIENLAPKVDRILIGGGIANTFLAAEGKDVSDSLYESEMLDQCKKLLTEQGQKITLPVDHLKEELGEGKFAIMDIGPETRRQFTEIIGEAKTIFWNGNMGKSEDQEYSGGTKAVAEAIGNNGNTTVAAGGDTVGFILSHNLQDGISFISTGGGAALEFLAGDKLPGVEALNKNDGNNPKGE